MEKPSVLVVEDSAPQAAVLARILAKNGFEVLTATDGSEALAALLGGEAVDIVVTDIVMPKMTGYELCQAIKENPGLCRIPVILLTALQDMGEAFYGLAAKADGFVTKPCRPEYLVQRIRYLLDMHNRDSDTLELEFQGRSYTFENDPRQMVSLLISTFENAIEKNTELLNANRDLADVKKQLEEKNAQKNQLLGMVAHDLRNPLQVVTGFAELLSSGAMGALTDEQTEVMNRILESSEFMSELIEDLLDMTAIESGCTDLNLAAVDVNALLARAVELNQLGAAPKSIVLVYSAADTPSATLDARKIEQVINNLISNAVKYSKPNTRVGISAQVSDQQLTIAVKDEGQGIPADEIEEVFVPFKKTSVRATAGERSTGLGLAICRNIVEAHQGTIHCESEVGIGSTFTVTLPLVAPDLRPRDSADPSVLDRPPG